MHRDAVEEDVRGMGDEAECGALYNMNVHGSRQNPDGRDIERTTWIGTGPFSCVRYSNEAKKLGDGEALTC